MIGLFAGKDIEKGTELYLDYTKNYWNALNGRGIFCKCQSKNCLYSYQKYHKRLSNDIYDFDYETTLTSKIPTKRRRKQD